MIKCKDIYSLVIRLLAVGLAGAALSACAADLSKQQDPKNDKGPTNVEGRLVCVEPCDNNGPSFLELGHNANGKIAVKLISSDGQPIQGQRIHFELSNQSGAQDTSLSSRNSQTDKSGVASITVQSGTASGTASVQASVQSQRAINPLQFTVEISGPNEASYNVSLQHSGEAKMSPVLVQLYPKSDYTCSEAKTNLEKIREGSPSQNSPTAFTEKEKSLEPGVNVPDFIFGDIDNGESYTVIAKGKGRSSGNVQVAWGCAEGDTVEKGNDVEVSVSMTDHVPNMVGTYEVMHQFNLQSGLPPGVNLVVELLGRLTTDPGSFIFGCPNDASGSDPCADSPGAQGLLEILAGFLPDDSGFRDTVESFLNLNVANDILRDFVNDIAQTWLENKAPDWLGNTTQITGDIFETLNQFRVEGTLQIKEVNIDPNSGTGAVPEGKGVQKWNKFMVQWTGNCDETTDPDTEARDECTTRAFGPGAIGDDGRSAVQGTFGADIVSAKKIRIKRHSLDISYGVLLVSIIERVVLPQIFGQNCGPNEASRCNSIARVLKAMISCQGLAQSVSDKVGGDRDTTDSLRSLCNNLLSEAGRKLKDYASDKLVAEGGKTIEIATPAGQTCNMHQPSEYPDDWTGYPLPYIGKIGKEKVEDDAPQCQWDVELNLAGAETTVDGQFWGQRQQ